VLDRIWYWIGSYAGSDLVLDIRSGAGSDRVLDPISYWVRCGAESDQVLDPIWC